MLVWMQSTFDTARVPVHNACATHYKGTSELIYEKNFKKNLTRTFMSKYRSRLTYWTPSYIIVYWSYALLKMVLFFWPTLYIQTYIQHITEVSKHCGWTVMSYIAVQTLGKTDLAAVFQVQGRSIVWDHFRGLLKRHWFDWACDLKRLVFWNRRRSEQRCVQCQRHGCYVITPAYATFSTDYDLDLY